MTKVIALAGKIGSGKTTIAKALAEFLEGARVSFGDYVRQVVAQRGLPQTRENLQVVGTELLKNDLHGFCRAVLLSQEWIPDKPLVLDGLRHAETIDPIRQIVSPRQLEIVFIDIDEKVRLERLLRRGDVDETGIKRADSHSSEYQVLSTLRGEADMVVLGSDPLGQIVRRIAAAIKKQ